MGILEVDSASTMCACNCTLLLQITLHQIDNLIFTGINNTLYMCNFYRLGLPEQAYTVGLGFVEDELTYMYTTVM